MELSYGDDPRHRKSRDRELLIKRERKILRERKLLDDKRKDEAYQLHLTPELLENESISLKIDSNLSDENQTSVKGSRWVSVDTLSTSPVGRSEKRPIKVKDEIIKFRCTAFEKKMLKIKAKRTGLTLSEYFRRVAFEQKIVERLTDEEIEIYLMLTKYHNNFKSIGNMFRKKNSNLSKAVFEIANEIKIHLKKFNQ